MGISIEDIRRGIIELETKEVDGSYTYQMSDDDIQHYYIVSAGREGTEGTEGI